MSKLTCSRCFRVSTIAFAVFLSFHLLTALSVSGQTDELRRSINAICESLDGEIGIASIHLASGDTFNVNGQKRFPMQSVFKFHLGMAALHEVDKGTLQLDKKINFTVAGRIPNTWSPLAKKYPHDAQVTLGELIENAVSMSDNNACDFLFRELGGTAVVDRYMQTLIPGEMQIRYTEAEMHSDWDFQFTNWTTPAGLARLFRIFQTQPVLSEASRKLLWDWLASSPTGPKRIKGKLPAGTVVAHKTGTGGENDEHVIGAVNDAGIIVLPDGSQLVLVILVTRARGEYEEVEEVIATVARAMYDYYAAR